MPMKRSFVCLCRKYNHAIVLVYYFVVYKWFSYLESSVRPKYFMLSKLDMYIPFVKEFVVPYLIWFAYIAIIMIYLGLRSKYDFLKLSFFMFSGMSICFIIYTVLPNGQNLRPEIMGNDIFSSLVKMIYKNDTPTNSAPSIHVINAIAVHLALVNYEGLRNKICTKAASFILMIFIIMSTVFIKQHSILDVTYGIMLSIILYLLIYRINYRRLFDSLNLKKKSKEPFNIK